MWYLLILDLNCCNSSLGYLAVYMHHVKLSLFFGFLLLVIIMWYNFRNYCGFAFCSTSFFENFLQWVIKWKIICKIIFTIVKLFLWSSISCFSRLKWPESYKMFLILRCNKRIAIYVLNAWLSRQVQKQIYLMD